MTAVMVEEQERPKKKDSFFSFSLEFTCGV